MNRQRLLLDRYGDLREDVERMLDAALAVAVDERRRRRSSNRNNGKSAVVTINDRGPFVRGRVIDLTPCCSYSSLCSLVYLSSREDHP
jgi:hypothetical protein